MDRRKQHQQDGQADGAVDDLEFGRAAFAERAWEDAWRRLSQADSTDPLAAEDLERLATSAYLTARDEDYLQALDRAHRAWLDAGDSVRAARAAFWLGLRLIFRGESGPATGWFGRAERLLQQAGRACVEEGYLLLPVAEKCLRSGDTEGAGAAAGQAGEIGDRFADADLSACARHLQGRVRLREGEVENGLALLDEAMVAVSSGELSPIMTGLIYCSVIDACHEVFAVDRAREWTSALAAWCGRQSQLVAFTGTCLVHRAEIMQINGDWQEAMDEASRAQAAFARAAEKLAPATALYQQAEVHRLRGEFEEAEEAYRRAGQIGYEPQPGLALLRLAEGRIETAATAIRRALAGAAEPLRRVRLLPACVEILLAAGDLEEARRACRELEESADRFPTTALRGLVAQAQGSVALAAGDAPSSLEPLQRAFEAWQGISAPYLAARTRELLGRACRALEDDEAADMHLASARETYETLGAIPDVVRLDTQDLPPAPPSGLSPRELQVLRLVAAGKTNKAVAAELGLSERTVDRHVSNILDKLGVSSRTAAAAWAYRHELV